MATKKNAVKKNNEVKAAKVSCKKVQFTTKRGNAAVFYLLAGAPNIKEQPEVKAVLESYGAVYRSDLGGWGMYAGMEKNHPAEWEEAKAGMKAIKAYFNGEGELPKKGSVKTKLNAAKKKAAAKKGSAKPNKAATSKKDAAPNDALVEAVTKAVLAALMQGKGVN